MTKPNSPPETPQADAAPPDIRDRQQIVWMLESLRRRMHGHDVAVVRRDQLTGESFEAFRYEDVEKQIDALSKVKPPSVLAAPEGKLRERLRGLVGIWRAVAHAELTWWRPHHQFTQCADELEAALAPLVAVAREGSETRCREERTMKAVEFKEGDRFELPYPFSRSTYEQMEGGDEQSPPTFSTVASWKVGPTNENVYPDACISIADALGTMVLTVVSIHQPGRFPTRVFFTRTWITPDGKPFGKTKCRMTTAQNFRLIKSGYRHEYQLRGCKCDGCEWPTQDHRRQGQYRPAVEDHSACDAVGEAHG